MASAIRSFVGLILGLLLAAGSVLALDSDGLRALKSAGFDDATITLLVAHRSLETGRLTVEELVSLKRAGLGEAALRQLIEGGSFVRRPSARVYRSEGALKHFLTASDIITLKEAGIGDAVLQALVRGEDTQGAPAGELAHARRMLDAMGIVIDARTAPPP